MTEEHSADYDAATMEAGKAGVSDAETLAAEPGQSVAEPADRVMNPGTLDQWALVAQAVSDLASYWRIVAAKAGADEWSQGFAQAMRENADDLETRFSGWSRGMPTNLADDRMVERRSIAEAIEAAYCDCGDFVEHADVCAMWTALHAVGLVEFFTAHFGTRVISSVKGGDQ